MATYAVMNGNVVTNIIVADTLEIAEEATQQTCIEYTDKNPACINGFYDFETKTFSRPIDPNDENIIEGEVVEPTKALE